MVAASRLDEPDYGCGLQLSGDGGRGWVTADPVPALPPGAAKCYAPEVAFDRNGVLYFLFVGLAGRANRPMGAFLTTSADRGQSFSAPRQVLGPNPYQVRMAIDPTLGRRGRLHLVWVQASAEPSGESMPPGPNPILAVHSDDGGATFSAPVPVSDPGRPRVMAPAVAIGRHHALQVAYYDLGDDKLDYLGVPGAPWDRSWALVAASSTDGGTQFREVTVDAGVVPPGPVMVIFTMASPALIADRRGRVFVGWPDARDGQAVAMVAASADGGRSWRAPARLDAGTSPGRQDLPAVAVAPGGRLDAVFYDRRDDPAQLENNLYYTYSTDGGRTFAAPLRLTTKGSDSRIGHTYPYPRAAGLVDFGARLGLVSADHGMVAAWTDTRNATDYRQQDIFSVVVELPASGSGVGSPRVPLLGAAAATIAAVGAALRRLRRGRARR